MIGAGHLSCLNFSFVLIVLLSFVNMNKIIKNTVAFLCASFFLVGMTVAQNGGATASQAVSAGTIMPHCPPPGVDMGFASVEACYIPWLDGIVLIDSVECAVHFLVRDGNTMVCRGSYRTDVYMGRHDLAKIIRPKSVAVVGNSIVVLASAKNDTSILAFIPLTTEVEADSFTPSAVVGLGSSTYAFRVLPETDEILVVGKNPVGYDMHYVEFSSDDPSNAKLSTTYHYHVPRQSERIKSSDPVGVGLTVVAIFVVFLLLTCICFIMKGFAAGVQRMQKKKEAPAVPVKAATADAANKDGEIYAAIAAAIVAYTEELHDEEDAVITIQKVERAWTPWNAKFYNMNHYFNNHRR